MGALDFEPQRALHGLAHDRDNDGGLDGPPEPLDQLLGPQIRHRQTVDVGDAITFQKARFLGRRALHDGQYPHHAVVVGETDADAPESLAPGPVAFRLRGAGITREYVQLRKDAVEDRLVKLFVARGAQDRRGRLRFRRDGDRQLRPTVEIVRSRRLMPCDNAIVVVNLDHALVLVDRERRIDGAEPAQALESDLRDWDGLDVLLDDVSVADGIDLRRAGQSGRIRDELRRPLGRGRGARAEEKCNGHHGDARRPERPVGHDSDCG